MRDEAKLREDAPNDKIYLQVKGNEYEGYDTITWCNDKINDDDVEYIRADVVKAQEERV
jgi:hypothetical protein